jgi:hypothetical protein
LPTDRCHNARARRGPGSGGLAAVFPFIAQLIGEHYEQSGDYVRHDELAQALQEHPEARGHIDNAVKEKGHAPFVWANWMVQWFSAAITEGRSPYQDDFERERSDNQWAYRPLPPAPDGSEQQADKEES